MNKCSIYYTLCSVIHYIWLIKSGGNALNTAHIFMPSFKVGHLVKFKTPFPDEDPEQAYIIKEVKVGYEDTRIDISPLNLGLAFPPVYTVRSTDLIIEGLV